jgi:hypothetical protein
MLAGAADMIAGSARMGAAAGGHTAIFGREAYSM